ncbi:MAG: flagellar protein export ATPase FliI [Candidatus Marinimicrobia bacterium]|nr:flagellar protein export ATPase FliI [Candidatus Neomarinimicrobiota bacterium]
MSLILEHIEHYVNHLPYLNIDKIIGKVTKVVGLVIEATLPDATMGELCEIFKRDGSVIRAEVVGFRENKILLMPLDETIGISPGSKVIKSPKPLSTLVGGELLGRVIDGFGNPIDGKGPINTKHKVPVYNSPPGPMDRKRIKDPLTTGIKAIDSLITIGLGQRVGIFAGSGVGKSVTLGMIAKYTDAEINVIGLIGERGREVKEFIERDLGEQGLRRSVVIVATSDQAAMVRVKASFMATAIAEYFRDQGKNVMLMMDSLTRFAMAQREIGLAAGEPPATKGYTPSVFAAMPRLLERAGTSFKGTITGLYTVLVESDDMDEPISDAARSILDGHVVLSRKLANRGHYPAIDVLESVSRLKNEVTDPEHRKTSLRILEILSNYYDSEDLIKIGAYQEGTNPKIDEAIQKIDRINEFLKQGTEEAWDMKDTVEQMTALLGA